MKINSLAIATLIAAGWAGVASASTGPAVCVVALDAPGAVLLTGCPGPDATMDRHGRGKDDPAGHGRRGRGKDDGAGHTGLTQPEDPVQEARRGRGKDDGPGHVRHGRGKDDPVGHG